MNPPKCDDLDSIHLLMAAQRVFTCTEAARCAPEGEKASAHDAFTRRLSRQPLETKALGQEAKELADTKKGLLILTTLDKPYAEKMDFVTYHWSGKHRRVVEGISLLTWLWKDGKALIPCDVGVHDKPQAGKSKSQHFQQMLKTAKERGCEPEYVLRDSWYSALENLKLMACFGSFFLTRLKSNRLVNPDGKGNGPIASVEIPAEGRAVRLRGFGFVKVFRTVSKEGDEESFATRDLGMREEKRGELEREGWRREVSHRALKQSCGVEKAQVRKAVSILCHLLLALRAFLRLEVYRLRTGVSWYEAKIAIVREAIRSYLAHPLYLLHLTA